MHYNMVPIVSYMVLVLIPDRFWTRILKLMWKGPRSTLCQRQSCSVWLWIDKATDCAILLFNLERCSWSLESYVQNNGLVQGVNSIVPSEQVEISSKFFHIVEPHLCMTWDATSWLAIVLLRLVLLQFWWWTMHPVRWSLRLGPKRERVEIQDSPFAVVWGKCRLQSSWSIPKLHLFRRIDTHSKVA